MNIDIHTYWTNPVRDWRLWRVRDGFRLLNGYPFPSNGFNSDQRGLPLIRIRDLMTGTPDVFFDGSEGLDCLVKDGDIVIGMDGDFNVGWWTFGAALLNQRLCALRPLGCFDARFTYYQLPIALQIINDLTPSSTVKHLSSLEVLALRLPAPDLETQNAIASYLDRETARIDQLIAKKERQAEVLAEREEATFLGVVTGRARAGSKVHSRVEWIGDIPAHWQAPKFTHVARQETGHTPSRKEETYWVPDECVTPWFSLADVWQIRDGGQVYVNETAEKVSQLGLENSAARLLPAQTVILSRTASVGFPAILSIPMATTQDFVGWICGERARPKFLYYVLRSMKPVFRRLMMGSTHQTIYMPDIRSFRLPLPPLVEQDEIIRELDQTIGAFRAAAVKIRESVIKLKEYRAALITAAVTGQIDIREKATPIAIRPDRSRFRVIVGAEIAQRHQGNPKFGRVKFQKELYLAEAHAGISELQGTYLREAAGPLDRTLVEETERGMETSAFCRTALPDIHAKSGGVTYKPLEKAGQHATELASLLGPRVEALRTVIDLLRDFETRSVEAVATLYAIWNDALIDGETPDDAAIIRGVLNDWHPEKQEKFTKADLQHWLDWMKRNGLVPRGEGPRTVSTTPRDLFAS